MSKESTSAEIQKALKMTVEAYTPLRVRFKRLLDFKEEIQQLRNRRASFAAIAGILRKHGVETSVEIVRLYHQELTGRRGHKGKRCGRPAVSAATNRKAIPFKHPALKTLATVISFVYIQRNDYIGGKTVGRVILPASIISCSQT